MVSTARVLLTDGSYKNTLAAVRALGKGPAGFRVDVSSHYSLAQSRFSRFCDRFVRCPSPVARFQDYADWLESVYTGGAYDVIIPVGSESNAAASTIDHDIVRSRSAVPKPHLARIGFDKMATFVKMKELGVRVPNTVTAGSSETVHDFLDNCGGKAVLKPVTGSSSEGVVYVDCRDKADVQAAKAVCGTARQYIAQEYVEGEGRGYFGLYRDGRRSAYFMHRRLREFPSSGGVSVVAESIHDDRLLRLGDSIFSRLRWHGPGMLEFKFNPEDGTYTLIEINPKLWGSLELAIVSGVNFPNLIVQSVLGESIEQPDYRVGATFSWVLPWSVLCFISRLRGRAPADYEPGTGGHFTDISRHDLVPNLIQLLLVPYYVRKEWHRL
jgi:predicted ATP-grasp superfamily ATP-dependent carboligase